VNLSFPAVRAIRRQRGYTLIEIMIALVIALFLLWGLGTMVAGTRQTGSNQMLLAQLQDQQRLAMSMLSDVIQRAGYFDTNKYLAATDALTTPATVPATGLTLLKGQSLSGTHTSISAPDTIAVRYSTSGSDGIINCNGATSTTGATTYTNYFSVIPATTGANATPSQLQCSKDGKSDDGVPLVSNVVNMQMWYGVSTGASNTANVDTYMTADQVTASAGGWLNVTSVRVTLTFNNPLWPQAGQPQYVYFTRVIALQTRAGAVFP
jgi:type IV pilus assembly protein PilW